MKQLALLILLLALAGKACAQGDGPRVFLPAPTGINPLSLTYMNMDSNFNFAGNILIPNGGVSANIWALNYNRFFSLGGRLAEIWVTVIGGTVDGFVDTPQRIGLDANASGIGDPYLAMRVGLIGAPALKPADFAQHKHGFAMYALAGISLPWGEYNQSRPLNIGTNRWALRLGLPMTVPFGDQGATWLEVHPQVYLFGDNDEPFRTDQREQNALYLVEGHLSQNFTRKFWASLDLRYQNGGETTTDGINDDNKMNQWGGGSSVGYTFSTAWSGFISYGWIFGGSAANGKLWRARLIFVF